MFRLISTLGLALCLTLGLPLSLSSGAAHASVEEKIEHRITETLNSFMYGASVNDSEVHNQFWADELVYTSSSGTRFGKAELMAGVNEGEQLAEADVTTWFTAEDIEISQVGDAAIVNFTLVATAVEDGPPSDDSLERQTYFNTGVLIERDGRWQAVNWNATAAAEND